MDELLDSINDGDTLFNLSRENCSTQHVGLLEILLQRLKTVNTRLTDVWQSHRAGVKINIRHNLIMMDESFFKAEI